MNNTKYTPLFLSIAMILGVMIGSMLNYSKEAKSIFVKNPREQKIKNLINYIDYNYVDNVDPNKILDQTITYILNKLDPHSVYIPEDKIDEIKKTMSGEFIGIGIQFMMRSDSILVTSVIKGGPSEKSGILRGDRILMSGTDTLYGKNYNSEYIIKKLSGKKDSRIVLTLYRKKDKNTFSVSVVRASIPVPSIEATFMLDSITGYIKLKRFSKTSNHEFKASINTLLSKNAKELVIDLRDNSGGYLGIAIDIADELLEENKLIVFTKNNKGDIEESCSTKAGSFKTGNLYILIDENSASASEILAGALQDNDRATIIGRRSYGKGLVQQEINFKDGSAMRLTVARYYTPTGRSIQRPYSLGEKEDYESDYINRINEGELDYEESMKIVDSLKYTTPKGKIVYGGGGIHPDVFVAVDELHLDLVSFEYINHYTFGIIDNNRLYFDRYNADNFYELFDQDNSFYNKMVSDISIDKSNKLTHVYFRALLARHLFGMNQYYKGLKDVDNMLEAVNQQQ